MEFKKGDEVRLTGANGYVYNTTVKETYEKLTVELVPNPRWWQEVDKLHESDITIELVNRPTPTEPGIYRDNDDDYWVLDKDGVWKMFETGTPESAETVGRYSPFVRLVEVSE